RKKILERAAAARTENACVLVARAEALAEARELAGAAATFTEALGRNPDDVLALELRADARRHLGQEGGALEDYTRSLALSGAEPDLLAKRALCHAARG